LQCTLTQTATAVEIRAQASPLPRAHRPIGLIGPRHYTHITVPHPSLMPTPVEASNELQHQLLAVSHFSQTQRWPHVYHIATPLSASCAPNSVEFAAHRYPPRAKCHSTQNMGRRALLTSYKSYGVPATCLNKCHDITSEPCPKRYWTLALLDADALILRGYSHLPIWSTVCPARIPLCCTSAR
jgi:hypothetical protein